MCMKSVSSNVVLGIDIGTTNIRCYAYDSSINVVGKAFQGLPIQDLEGGWQEIIPRKLWEVFQNVIKSCLLSANLKAENITSLGISTQRGTFVTWNREFDDTFHNFITWKDKRAEKECQQWNNSLFLRLLRFGAFIIYLLTLQKKFQFLSKIEFSTSMVLIRLYWIFQNTSQLQNKKNFDNILFGTIDTWLVWKLTGGKIHATDASNACVTGFFDPFQMLWAKWLLKIFGIPSTILPVVKNSCDSFGETLPEIFGASIPIHAVVGDQQASLFGAGCFEKYDMNCTMGTGTFLHMNTGNSILMPYDGIYPLVGWTISSKTIYIIEGGVYDVGTLITWATKLGLIDDPENCDKIASSVSGNDEVYFLPEINFSLNGGKKSFSTSSIIGLKTHTSKEHLVRAILEALAFQVCELYNIVRKKYGKKKRSMFCFCGGVAKCNLILQLISNITSKKINRLDNIENSSMGAALLAGLYSGTWKNLEEIKVVIKTGQIISPDASSKDKSKKEFSTWRKACSHSVITSNRKNNFIVHLVLVIVAVFLYVFYF